MTFVERVLYEIEKKCISCSTVEKALGFGNGAIRRWNVSSPSIDKVIKLSNFLNVSVDYLLSGTLTDKDKTFTHLSEEEVLDIYNQLDDQGQVMISDLLTYVLDKRGPRTIYKLIEYEEIKPLSRAVDSGLSTRPMPIYSQPASAGTGAFLDSDDYDMVDLPINSITIQASFGVRVSGNSMEPVFEDEDIVLVKQQRTLNSGETGVFLLNGDAFIKKLMNAKGKYQLTSTNPSYKPIDINDNDELRIVGKVLGKYIIDE